MMMLGSNVISERQREQMCDADYCMRSLSKESAMFFKIESNLKRCLIVLARNLLRREYSVNHIVLRQ